MQTGSHELCSQLAASVLDDESNDKNDSNRAIVFYHDGLGWEFPTTAKSRVIPRGRAARPSSCRTCKLHSKQEP